MWKLRGSGKAQLISSRKLGGGGSRAAAMWSAGEDVMFCVGFDDGGCEIWELGGERGRVLAAPAASACAVRSLVRRASQPSSSSLESSQVFVGHTNGVVHMYRVTKRSAEIHVELSASIR